MAGPFKQYARGARTQVPEEIYGRGMQYTNTPLTEGFMKLLINFELKDNGAALKPRPALRPIEFVDYDGAVTEAYSDNLFIAAGKECVEEDGKSYKQLILGNCITKKLTALTVLSGALPQLPGIDLPVVEGLQSDLTSTARFITPAQAEIHGIPLADTDVIARHIGTFGFNNSYYFFDDTGLNQTRFDTDRYIKEAVAPREVSPKEAVLWGYNMLKATPYTFTNNITGGGGPIQLQGILPYDAQGKLLLSPKTNETVEMECIIAGQTGLTYTVVWEWKEPGSSAWVQLKSGNVTLAANTKLKCVFSAPNANVMVRVTATNTVDATDMQIMAVGFDFNEKIQGNARNSQVVTYDLKQAKQMTFWRNRLVLGVNNLLFFSDINDPGYFPYPNNMEPFNEQIVHLIPHLDVLLVFTTNSLYSVALATDGLSWIVKKIQSNLSIQPWDVHLIQTVKNMVFFKSGNYYYMVVPKVTSTTGELVVAPISKPLENLFLDFALANADIMEWLYYYLKNITLVHYYNYLDFEDIHNVYTFQTDDGVYINLVYLYNVVTRTWRMYVYESQHFVVPYRQDATKKGIYMGLVPVAGKPCVQFMRYTDGIHEDMYIGPEATVPELKFPNFQLLDTGYRELASDYKKRFREAQIKINNTSQKQLKFYNLFFVDGDERKSMSVYKPYHEVDPGSPNFGLLTMERELVDPDIVPGTTALGASEDDVDAWTLDVSRFPEIYIWKIRVPFSGKGYSPRMILISQNQKAYELLNNSWVFRLLNSR